MHVIVGVLRITGMSLFLLSVAHAIRPRALEVALPLAGAVLLLIIAEFVSPRTPAQ
jgi:hypothetical protein